MSNSLEAMPPSGVDREFSLTHLAVELIHASEHNQGEAMQEVFDKLEGELVHIAQQKSYERLPGEDEVVVVYTQAAERMGRPALVRMNEKVGRIELVSETDS